MILTGHLPANLFVNRAGNWAGNRAGDRVGNQITILAKAGLLVTIDKT
jgi:hypothetical protein